MTEQLRSLLVASDGLRAATPAFDPRTSERAFRLLVTDVGTIVFLPALLSRVARDGGRITVRAVPLDSRHFEAKPIWRWVLSLARRAACGGSASVSAAI